MGDSFYACLAVVVTLVLLWLIVRLLDLSIRGVWAILRRLFRVLWLILRVPLLPIRVVLALLRTFRGKNSASTRVSHARPLSAKAGMQSPVAIGFHWPSTGRFDFEVVGESFHQEAIYSQFQIQNEIEDGGKLLAFLVPESDNPHDDMAIAVLINDEPVGHMSRDDARSFRRRLALKGLAGAVTSCDVLIVGPNRHSRSVLAGGDQFYSVWLDLQRFRSRPA